MSGHQSAPTAAPSVLWVGIDPYRVPGPWDPDELAAMIRAGESRFPEGVLETWLFGQDDDLDVLLTDELVRTAWSCVVVGVGVRVGAVPLEIFEQIINLVHRHAPQAGIAFNSTLTDTWEAACRLLPDLG